MLPVRRYYLRDKEATEHESTARSCTLYACFVARQGAASCETELDTPPFDWCRYLFHHLMATGGATSTHMPSCVPTLLRHFTFGGIFHLLNRVNLCSVSVESLSVAAPPPGTVEVGVLKRYSMSRTRCILTLVRFEVVS